MVTMPISNLWMTPPLSITVEADCRKSGQCGKVMLYKPMSFPRCSNFSSSNSGHVTHNTYVNHNIIAVACQ